MYLYFIKNIRSIYIYNIDLKKYLGKDLEHNWVTLESNPNNAIDFLIEPLNTNKKSCIISNGGGYVMDISQKRINNRAGYWKKHNKPNQIFQFINTHTDLPIDPLSINEADEYRIMALEKCMYAVEPRPNVYELFVGDCQTHKSRSTFRLLNSKLFNDFSAADNLNSIDNYIDKIYSKTGIDPTIDYMEEMQTNKLKNMIGKNPYYPDAARYNEKLKNQIYKDAINEFKNKDPILSATKPIENEEKYNKFLLKNQAAKNILKSQGINNLLAKDLMKNQVEKDLLKNQVEKDLLKNQVEKDLVEKDIFKFNDIKTSMVKDLVENKAARDNFKSQAIKSLIAKDLVKNQAENFLLNKL